jgi:hypothetical protein
MGSDVKSLVDKDAPTFALLEVLFISKDVTGNNQVFSLGLEIIYLVGHQVIIVVNLE